MSLDEAVSVITLCSIGSANFAVLCRSLVTLRVLVVGQSRSLSATQDLCQCVREKPVS